MSNYVRAVTREAMDPKLCKKGHQFQTYFSSLFIMQMLDECIFVLLFHVHHSIYLRREIRPGPLFSSSDLLFDVVGPKYLYGRRICSAFAEYFQYTYFFGKNVIQVTTQAVFEAHIFSSKVKAFSSLCFSGFKNALTRPAWRFCWFIFSLFGQYPFEVRFNSGHARSQTFLKRTATDGSVQNT